jgi:histidinol dehydrogenase
MNIRKYIEPQEDMWPELVRRASEGDSDIEESVVNILKDVRGHGDSALLVYERRFDGADLSCGMKISDEEIDESCSIVPEDLKQAIATAYSNILKFHKAQLPGEIRVETSPSVTCVQRSVPIGKVGLYVPGGRAPLFSTVLMLCIPAKAAGCEDIILCTPPSAEGKANPYIIYAASFCGVRDIYKVGGAQAIAAMAYGTESISRRDKIFGPGNRYVMKAKQIVGQRQVAIDMPAGPSEVMVLADETAIPSFVAADFLSQDEHGPDSQSVLVCTSEEIAEAVEAEINRQMAELSRQNIIVKSLGNSRIIVLHDRDAIAAFANGYAPEHLIISMRDPWAIAGKIHAAGSIFIGNFSPESAGDYASGTNHTLPTSGWARSYSALGVESFMRRMTIQELSKDGLDGIGKAIETMAMAEGLDAHAAAVKVRLKDK